MSSRLDGFKLLNGHREGCWTEGDDKRFVVHDRTEFNRSKPHIRLVTR